MNRKQWLASGMLTALALGVLSGCQPVFLTREVYTDAHRPMLPEAIEKDHTPITNPITEASPKPPTVLEPDRPARYLTLQEAIAIALENGNASGRAGPGRGLGDDTLAQFNSASSLNSQTERIRVLALNPAFANAAMEAALSRYDAIWATSMSWNTTDGVQTGIFSSTNGHSALFGTGIVKPLPTGGVATFGFLTNYSNLTSPPTGAFTVLNPLYTARLSIGFEQPLLKDWGPVNQLLSRLSNAQGQALPGIGVFNNALNSRQGSLSSFVDRGSEGILISRLRFDQSRAEFERSVQVLLLNSEVAYWNLYNKYGQLYSSEANLRVIHKTWQVSYNRFKAGIKDAIKEYYPVLGQYQEFRAERIRALQEVLDAERQLRNIMGLPIEDGTRLVPITPPNLAELKPDWDASLNEALHSRPELVLARDNLRYHQYQLSIQENNLRPELRAFAKYEPVGFGNSLQGSDPYIDGTGTSRTGNAFQSLSSGQFADWQLGLNLIVPLGYRLEHAAIRGARLQLTQAYYFLRDQEEKTSRVVQQHYQDIAHWYERIKAHRDERLGYQEAVRNYLELVKGDQLRPGDLALLDAQRRYAAALIKEYNAIAEYNNAIARFEWSKGATLRYNNVHISEGALPQAVQVRATEYEKERSKSFVLLHRPDSFDQPGRHVVNKTSELPVIEAPAVMEEKFAPEPVAPPKPLPLPEEKKVPAKAMSLPTVEALVIPEKTTSLPKVEPTEVQPRPASMPRELDQRWAPLPQKKTDKGIDFKSSPTPNRLPDISEPNSIKPMNGPGLQTSNVQPSSSGFVTVEEPPPSLIRMSANSSGPREAIVASSLAPPTQALPEISQPSDRQTLVFPVKTP